MTLIVVRLHGDTSALLPHPIVRRKINELSTLSKSRSFYSISNSLLSEAYYLHEL
jgi:hypothetical protein